MNGRDIRLEALLEDFNKSDDNDGSKVERIYQAFLKTVDSGYWRPGDKLPTERQMAAALPVSEGTIQAVMRRLVDIGIVHRTRGRGSFISNVDEGDSIFIRFLSNATSTPDEPEILDVDILNVDISETTEGGPWSEFLGTRPSYIQMARRLSVNNELRVLGEFFFDGGRFRPLLDTNPETFRVIHVRKIIHDRFNAPILRVVRNIQFVPASETVASAIECAAGETVMQLEILNFSLRDEPIVYQRFFIPLTDKKLNIWDGWGGISH
jgi:GntR family transcriptional regulator